jgi:hypothetical protein
MSRQSAQRWRQGCQPYVPEALYCTETLFSLLLALISEEGLGKLKKSSIRIGTRDLPACTIALQSSML